MGSLIQIGAQRVRKRFRLPRTRHEAIKPAMVACILGVAAGVAMLAYGNFGRPSTVEAATTPQTLRIVAAPLDSSSPVPTGVENPMRTDPGVAATLASTEVPGPVDPTSDPIAPPELAGSQDPQMADDAAASGMTARVRPDSATLG